MGGLTINYVFRRLGMWLLTVWLGSTMIFFIPRLAPGDPVAAMVSRMSAQGVFVENSAQLIESWRARFGLDGPLYIQYWNYLKNLVRFDLGYSLASFPSNVNEMIANALPWTVGLLLIATVFFLCARKFYWSAVGLETDTQVDPFAVARHAHIHLDSVLHVWHP